MDNYELICFACSESSDSTVVVPIREFHQHNCIEHEGLSEKCILCPNLFLAEEDLQQHVKEFHKEDLCVQCLSNPGIEKTYPREQFTSHYLDFHPEATQKCVECPNKFQLSSQVDDHRGYWHGYEKQKPVIHCVNCEKSFHTRAAMKSHTESRHWKEKFRCGNCGNGYTTKEKCRDHFLGCKEKYD